jgi:phosphoribosylaminoimidazolecarboxamide formyltransferase/IMP cyclohydrolase
VIAVVDPADYDEVIERLSSSTDDENFRLLMMQKVYATTAQYDALISGYLQQKLGIELPEKLTLTFEKAQQMRYGENPHQRAAFYRNVLPQNGSIVSAKQLGGKELSFNNINDANGAIELLKEFPLVPAAVAIKHANPCGVAVAQDILSAYKKAYECDPVSIFGGIVALNRPVTKELAAEMVKIFLEIIIAPAFSKEALEIFAQKKNLRLLEMEGLDKPTEEKTSFKNIFGGLLLQTTDDVLAEKMETVTENAPDEKTIEELKFAYKVVKHVKSNAIVITRDFATVGIGVGQTNRVWAAQQAIEHAGERTKGAVAASDAFFPFSDSAQALTDAGVKAFIQPGGSIRDKESIETVDKARGGMVFTGTRHFKH